MIRDGIRHFAISTDPGDCQMTRNGNVEPQFIMGKQERRDFLKQGACIGILWSLGNLGLLSCSGTSRCKVVSLDDGEFSMTAYCCLDCSQCDAYISTKNNDRALKSRIAAQWGKKPEDINCLGCKSEKALFNCSAKKCAMERKVITCAHCKDFPICDNKIWNNQPEVRKRAEEVRRKLEAAGRV